MGTNEVNIDQDMDFATALATVNETLNGVGCVRWSRTCFGAGDLPGRRDPSSALMKINKLQYQALKFDIILPLMEALVNGCTAHPKPILMDYFP